jgi:hypothetical protein
VIAQIHTISPEIADGLNEWVKGYQFEQITQLTE